MIRSVKQPTPSKPTKQNPRSAAAVAIAALRRCGRDIRTVTPAVQLGDDPEALHDLRVAVRRARAVLGQYAIALDHDGAKALAKQLRWLGRTTALARDLDVLALAIAAWLRTLGPTDRSALVPLVASIDGARARAHQGLASALQSPRMAETVAAFANLRPSTTEPAANQSATALGAARCAQTLRRLAADIATIEALSTSPTDASLHALRIVVKKARYRLQLQRELKEATHGRKLLRSLTKLQGALGRLQDAAVGQRRLLSLAQPAEAQATVAAGRLLERVDAARTAAGADARALLPKVRRRADRVASRLDREVAEELVGVVAADAARAASLASVDSPSSAASARSDTRRS